MKYSNKKTQTWTNNFVQIKQQKLDMRFGTLNVMSLYRAGSLTTAARELAGYKLALVSVEVVRWDTRGMVRAGDYNFVNGKRKSSI